MYDSVVFTRLVNSDQMQKPTHATQCKPAVSNRLELRIPALRDFGTVVTYVVLGQVATFAQTKNACVELNSQF